MKGAHTGLSYGPLFGGWFQWHNNARVACGNYPSTGGDSGSPMFIHYGNQVYAAGVHVGRIGQGDSPGHCFVTIQDLLAMHNAWLPVFPVGSLAHQLLTNLSADAEAGKLPVINAGKPIFQ